MMIHDFFAIGLIKILIYFVHFQLFINILNNLLYIVINLEFFLLNRIIKNSDLTTNKAIKIQNLLKS